jgi:hypothetical protein
MKKAYLQGLGDLLAQRDLLKLAYIGNFLE